jgi:hypothetical protein
VVSAVGNPDLSGGGGRGRQRAEPPRGFVVFPIEGRIPGRRVGAGAGWLRDWWIVIAAVFVATAVIAAALIVR